jgi:hypothetical protein
MLELMESLDTVMPPPRQKRWNVKGSPKAGGFLSLRRDKQSSSVHDYAGRLEKEFFF